MKNEKPGGRPGDSKIEKAHLQSTASSPAGQVRVIEASNWQPFSKNTLQGFVDLLLPSGLRIHGCLLHEKNGERWISFPGKPYSDQDGNRQWGTLLEFPDKTRLQDFQRQALAAVDRLKKGGRP